MTRRIAALLAAVAAAAALSGCGTDHASAPPLREGTYSGTLPSGQPVNLEVSTGTVQLNGRDTYLVDPTTTAQFLVAGSAQSFYEWSCTMAENGRSLHCDTWMAPRGNATPTAIPCVSPAPNTPSWCAGQPHQPLDLLRICSSQCT